MRALVCFVILFLSGCASIPGIDTHFAAARDSSVQIRTIMGSGSGVILNEHCVLTVAHVADQKTFEAKTHSGRVSSFTTVIADPSLDIAIGCTQDRLDGPPVRIAGDMPEIYSKVFVIGNPLGYHEVLTEGRYEGSDMVSAPIGPGNSGGGVFNEAGELIGLADAIPVMNGIGYAHIGMLVGLGIIHEYLAQNESFYKKVA